MSAKREPAKIDQTSKEKLMCKGKVCRSVCVETARWCSRIARGMYEVVGGTLNDRRMARYDGVTAMGGDEIKVPHTRW
jgi:hypothetical protein